MRAFTMFGQVFLTCVAFHAMGAPAAPSAIPAGPVASSSPTKPPNILIILADDMGYSDLGCYGGEIQTPNIDGLAKDGIRFTQFYNTARCWPSRAAIMTGYYAQQVRADPPQGRVPSWAQTIPQVLKPFGYRSYHSGKWHIFGEPKSCADAGFDHSYRIDDPNHHFNPKVLSLDDHPLPPVPPDSGYYDTTAIADHMIDFLKEHQEKYPDQPFFGYVAYLSPHFPLMAPPQDIAKYKDRYLEGWDAVRVERLAREKQMGLVNCELSAREPQIRAADCPPGAEAKISPDEIAYALPWDSLSQDQKNFQAAKMAVHAAMVDRLDQETGRILDQVKAMGAWDNTIIFVLSDNGASSELMLRGDGNDQTAPAGSAKSFLCIGPGWATMSNTPFRRYKMWVQEGGISTPAGRSLAPRHSGSWRIASRHGPPDRHSSDGLRAGLRAYGYGDAGRAAFPGAEPGAGIGPRRCRAARFSLLRP